MRLEKSTISDHCLSEYGVIETEALSTLSHFYESEEIRQTSNFQRVYSVFNPKSPDESSMVLPTFLMITFSKTSTCLLFLN